MNKMKVALTSLAAGVEALSLRVTDPAKRERLNQRVVHLRARVAALPNKD